MPELTARRKNAFASIAGQLQGDHHGRHASIRTALRRLNPDDPARASAAVIQTLLKAGVPNASWRHPDGFRRWALVCHFIAVLSGSTGRKVYAPAGEAGANGQAATFKPSRAAGHILRQIGYSEPRLMRLTSAHGPALADQIRRLARYLAAAAPSPFDFSPIMNLAVYDDSNPRWAEAARVAIATHYYDTANETPDRPDHEGNSQ